MATSSRLSAEMVRAAMRVVGECRDVGNDPAAWNLRIACFFLQHLRSVFTSCFTLTMSAAEPTVQELLCTFWADNRLHRRWLKYMTEHGYRKYPSVQRFSERYSGQSFTVTRQELVPNREWRDSAERGDRLAVHQDETMLSIEPFSGGLAHVFSVNRAIGDQAFTSKEKALVRLIHEELGRLFGKRLNLKLDSQVLPSDLSPRMQAVLICLLSGDSEKEIASRLRLSVHTIHEYVTDLYRRFEIHSRAELLSRAHLQNWIPQSLPP